jgi:large subunit ribosomal protein L29
MKTAEYRSHLKKLNQSELHLELEKVEQELFNLRLNVKAGQMKNYARLSLLRRNVARVKTRLQEQIVGKKD